MQQLDKSQDSVQVQLESTTQGIGTSAVRMPVIREDEFERTMGSNNISIGKAATLEYYGTTSSN